MHICTAQSRLELLRINEGNQAAVQKVHNPSTRLSNFIWAGQEIVDMRPFLQPQRIPASTEAEFSLKGGNFSNGYVNSL